MKVKDLMTKSACSIHSSQSLNEAAHLMWELDCGFMPVSDEDERVVGVVTDRDICMAAYTNGAPIDAIPVNTAMSSVVFSCTDKDSIDDAENVMSHHQVRRLPVLDDKHKLVGILSLNDIALAYKNRSLDSNVKATDIVKTLASVSAHTHGSLITLAS